MHDLGGLTIANFHNKPDDWANRETVYCQRGNDKRPRLTSVHVFLKAISLWDARNQEKEYARGLAVPKRVISSYVAKTHASPSEAYSRRVFGSH